MNAIIQEYKDKRKSIEKRIKTVALGGVAAIVILAGVGIYSEIRDEFIIRKNPVGSKYKSITRTLSELEGEKNIVSRLTYQPEHIRPHIEAAFSDRTKNASLDTAIELIRIDMEELENTSEFRRYQNAKSNKKSLAYMASMILVGFVTAGYMLLEKALHGRLRRKKEKESRI